MNNLPRQTLCEIIAQYGRSLCDDPRRTEALLRDFCGAHKREIFCLVSALKERVAADLLASQDGVPQEVLLARLAKRLRDNMALTEDAARWTVESWALALGMVSPKEPSESKKVVQSPIPTPMEEQVTLTEALDGLDWTFADDALVTPEKINIVLATFREAGITLYGYDDIVNRARTSKRLGRKGKFNALARAVSLACMAAFKPPPPRMGYLVQSVRNRDCGTWRNAAFSYEVEEAQRWAREEVAFRKCPKTDVRIIRSPWAEPPKERL